MIGKISSTALWPLLLVGPAFALQYVRTMSLADSIAMRAEELGRPLTPEDVAPFQLDEQYINRLEWQLIEIADTSRHFLPLCTRVGAEDVNECTAPQTRPYPLLPLTPSERNVLLHRPPPEVANANVKEATKGNYSTVDEFLKRAIAHLGDLEKMSDDELTLLASNFRHSKAEWLAGIECAPVEQGPWDEDFLVPEEEQRALAAGFLYVFRHPLYRMRREQTMREEIGGPEWVQEQIRKEALKAVNAAVAKFKERLARLNREPFMTEERWQARYDENVAIFEASLHQLLANEAPEDREEQEKRLGDLVTATEDVMDQMICSDVPVTEPGFELFVEEEEPRLKKGYGDIRKGRLFGLAYLRWKALGADKRAVYVSKANAEAKETKA